MASTASTTVSSVSSLDAHSNSKLIVGGPVTRKPWNQEDHRRFQLTTARIQSVDRGPNEIPPLYALSLTSGARPGHYPGQLPNQLPLTVRQTVTNGPWITPQSAKTNDNLETYRLSDASSQRTVSSDSANPQARFRWYDSFLNGCWSNTRPEFYAAHVVSYGPWTNKSTPNLLAKMFMAQYARAFTHPWVFNTGTLRILGFLEAVERWLKKERGALLFLKFRASVRKSALDSFHLSIDLAAPDVLLHSCYLGAIFRHGFVCETDVLCALARIARLAKRLEYFQAFYYLLTEAGAELYSQPCATREIRQHAWVLGDTLTDSDEPVCSLRWYILIEELIETHESRSHPHQDSAIGGTSRFR